MLADASAVQVMLIQTIPQSALLGISAYSRGTLTKIYSRSQSAVNRTSENNQYGARSGDAGFNSSLIDNVALLNGKYLPTLQQASGRWRRWRVLHAGPAFFSEWAPLLSMGLWVATMVDCWLALDPIYLKVSANTMHCSWTSSPEAVWSDMIFVCARTAHSGPHARTSGHSHREAPPAAMRVSAAGEGWRLSIESPALPHEAGPAASRPGRRGSEMHGLWGAAAGFRSQAWQLG